MSFSFNENVLKTYEKKGTQEIRNMGDKVIASDDHPARRRSVDDMLDVTPTVKRFYPHPHSQEHNAPNKAARSFQRKQFHLQDTVWGTVKKDIATDDLQAITESLDRLGLRNKLGRQVMSAPRSSSRFDWYYKSLERQARRDAQKSKLRRKQGQRWEQMSRLSSRGKRAEELDQEVEMDGENDGAGELENDGKDCRRRSR